MSIFGFDTGGSNGFFSQLETSGAQFAQNAASALIGQVPIWTGATMQQQAGNQLSSPTFATPNNNGQVNPNTTANPAVQSLANQPIVSKPVKTVFGFPINNTTIAVGIGAAILLIIIIRK